MIGSSTKSWFLTWLAGFFAFPAFLHIFRMAFQLDLVVGGFAVPMVWSTAIIAISIIISVALLLAAVQENGKEREDVVEPREVLPVEKKPADRSYGSENFEGEDSMSSADTERGAS